MVEIFLLKDFSMVLIMFKLLGEFGDFFNIGCRTGGQEAVELAVQLPVQLYSWLSAASWRAANLVKALQSFRLHTDFLRQQPRMIAARATVN